MKITHFIRNFEIGGLESVVLRLAELQVVNGYEVRIVCIEKEQQAVLDYSATNINIVKLNKKSRLLTLIRVFFELIRNRPDVINTHNFLANVYGAYVGHLLRIPICLTLHSGDCHCPKEFRRPSMFVPHHFICVSSKIKDMLLSSTDGNINEDLVSIINNGIDPGSFVNTELSNAREEFEISKNTFLVGTVGRLQPIKNQKILLEAIAVLSKKNVNVHLLVIGDGPLRYDLESLSISLGIQNKVCFAGSRNDVARLLAGMDVFVLPSLAEGSPISLIEAMSVGLPVVATAVGAIPNIIQNKINGYLVPSADLPALVKRLKYIIENTKLSNDVGKRAYETIQKEHSMDKMLLSYYEIYKNISGCH